MSRHQIHRPSKAGPGDFQPYFDWSDESPSVGEMPPEGLAGRIAEGCERHMRGGGLIVRGAFGVSTVNCVRENRGKDARGQTIWGGISGVYEVKKHCCPLAPLLDGLPSRFNPLADFALVLGVDHFWVLGFVHAINKEILMLGKRLTYFEESLSYVDGRAVGARIAERFVVTIQGGWEV